MSDSEKKTNTLLNNSTKKSKSEKNVKLKSEKLKKKVKSCKTKVMFKKANKISFDDQDCIKIQDTVGEIGMDISFNMSDQETKSNDPKHTKDIFNAYELKLFCQKYNKPPPLLLNYTYFLNDEYTKYISIGFQQKDFKPGVIIHSIGENCVELSFFEWLSLFVYIPEIDNAFQTQKMEKIIVVTDEIYIKYYKDNNQLLLRKNATIIQITKADWIMFLRLTEFFSFIFNWYNQTSEIAKNYYIEYIDKCKQNGVTYLDSSSYFEPKTMKKNCNFSRLFYEIGFMKEQ